MHRFRPGRESAPRWLRASAYGRISPTRSPWPSTGALACSVSDLVVETQALQHAGHGDRPGPREFRR